jgi:competence protein ComEC
MLGQRERWVLWAPVPLGAGICAYFSLPFEPGWVWGAGGLILCILLLAAFHKKLHVVYMWIPIFLCVLGFGTAQLRTHLVTAPVLHKRIYATELQGRIAAIDVMPRGYRVVLDEIEYADKPQPDMPLRVRLKLKAKDTYVPRAGDIIKVRAGLLPLSKPVLPGAFDFQRHAFFQQLGATGYALSNVTVIETGQKGFVFDHLRDIIRRRVADSGVADRDTQGLMTAFLIGDSKAISENDWNVARQSGIAHLIAISGSHFVMIVGVTFFLMRAILAAFPRVALRWPIKKISAVAAAFMAIFYMLLIGAPVPAQRAAAMSCAIMLAIVIDRDPLTLRVAAFAALLLLVFSPESVTGASFQLSFAAVVGLVAFFEWFGAWRQKQKQAAGEDGGESVLQRCGIVMLGCFLTTLVAAAATAPFALYHFSKVPFLAGLVANMVAVPLSSFVTFPAGLVGCLLMPFGLEQGPLWIMARSIELIMQTAVAIAAWPATSLHSDGWPAGVLAMIALGGLWVCLWQGRMRWMGVVPAVIGLAMIPFAARPDVMVSGDIKNPVMALRADDGRLALSPGRQNGFVREEWVEREGGKGAAAWEDLATCDDRACHFKKSGKSVLFLKTGAATEEDCAEHDFIISPFEKRPQGCKGQVIDKWDLYWNGAHAIYLAKGRVDTVAGERGVRPWTGRQNPYGDR